MTNANPGASSDDPHQTTFIDAVVVGSGVMGATLTVMLRHLAPQLRLEVFEAAESISPESSAGWHNAGTGHAGLCELAYTPAQQADGSVDVRKAIEIFSQFEASRQLWAWGVEHGVLPAPRAFVNAVPHLSFVEGAASVEYLRARYKALSQSPLFAGMEFTSDPAQVREWVPLMMEGRRDVPVAATRARNGTDVNFGALSQQLLGWASQQDRTRVTTGSRVTDLKRVEGGWRVRVRQKSGESEVLTRRVFIGAGGGSLALLQKAGIPEAHGIGGFPIGGQWLACDNPDVVARHNAKVYGQSPGAAPTLAVPHLDRRIIDGRTYLLFGPFAAWTTKFLHESGSPLDLVRSVKPHNLGSLLTTGMHNLDLIRYLWQQGVQTQSQRMESLRTFYPEAVDADWKLVDAGIRVQAIKQMNGRADINHFGTEVITDQDRTLAALLGASPGASVSVDIAIQIVRACFADLLTDEGGYARMKEMVPTFDVDIALPEHREFYEDVSRRATEALGLPLL